MTLKRLKVYWKECRRCRKFYNTTARTGKICQECNLQYKNNRNKKNDNNKCN